MSKAENLKILKDNGINVPSFIVLSEEDVIDLSFSSQNKFAVRSSCNAEDSDSSAFAGQFETLLNVQREDIEAAVRTVRNSYSSESVMQYAKQRNITDLSMNGSVIIQEMIDADYSGVMFSANPLGLLNEIVITVGNGLGDNVVSDKVYTTTYYFNRDDNQYFYTTGENTPQLTEQLLSALVEYAIKIRNIYSREMDIEFAIKDNVVYILQARPITTLSGNGKRILDNSNIVESYPGRTLPITQDFAREVYYKIFSSLCLHVSGDESLINSISENLKNMVIAVDGGLYYCIENWYALLKLIPFSKAYTAVWQRMLGIENKTIPDTKFSASVFTKLKIAIRFIQALIHNSRNMEDVNKWFEMKYPDYSLQIDMMNDISGLLRLYHSLIDDITSRWDATLINDMYAFIFTALAGSKNKSNLASIKNLESVRPVLELNNLVKSKNSPEFEKLKSDYIEQFGDRCLGELKLETQTYRTNPELLDAKIATEAIECNYECNTQIVMKDTFFVKRAKKGIAYRESSRLHRSRMFGLARKIMLKIGEILVASNCLDNKTDIFYLHESELSKPCDYRSLVSARKQEHEDFKKIPIFNRLVFENEVFNHSTFCVHTDVLSTDTELVGIPASVGNGKIIEGEALVVSDPNDISNISGKILITTSTDPGWVFLIKDALGIIAEKGSLLSHTAIITRELGKPSIVNVPHATRKIVSGDVISMNVSSGVIKIISRRDNK